MASSARARASWRVPIAVRLAHTAAGDQGANPFIEEQEPSYATGDLTGYREFHQKYPFQLSTGASLPELKVAYETWGELNADRDNAILLQTGMSASSHACSHAHNSQKGWWEDFIGPGKTLDTNLFHIICTNNLGGCYGSTGPSSINPADGKPYGSRFPRFEIVDQVTAQFGLLDHLGIQKLHACVGSSLGGMQSVCAAATFPERVGKFVSISACAKSFPGTIAFRHAQRTAIRNDPDWNQGDYYDGPLPEKGLRLAREIGTITYRSGTEWRGRFGQRRVGDADGRPTHGLENEFHIENYLTHQGVKWVNNYDPNSMLWISKAMDGFSMEKPGADGKPCLKAGLATAMMPALVIGVQHDVLFPVWQQKEIADSLREAGNPHVVYYELDCIFGHDSFLLDAVSIGPAVKGHLEQEPGGVKHIWEEHAANARELLQSVSSTVNIHDSMRSMFRALAKGASTVETDRLKGATKIMFMNEAGLTERNIDQIFAERLAKPEVTLKEFMVLHTAFSTLLTGAFLP